MHLVVWRHIHLFVRHTDLIHCVTLPQIPGLYQSLGGLRLDCFRRPSEVEGNEPCPPAGGPLELLFSSAHSRHTWKQH
jgi:hypothetical protein